MQGKDGPVPWMIVGFDLGLSSSCTLQGKNWWLTKLPTSPAVKTCFESIQTFCLFVYFKKLKQRCGGVMS